MRALYMRLLSMSICLPVYVCLLVCVCLCKMLLSLVDIDFCWGPSVTDDRGSMIEAPPDLTSDRRPFTGIELLSQCIRCNWFTRALFGFGCIHYSPEAEGFP